MLPMRSGANAGSWRNNPLIAVVAIAIALLVVLLRACACRPTRLESPTQEGQTEEHKGIARYCPHCDKVFVLTQEDIDKLPGKGSPFRKALDAPCPHCGATGSQETMPCAKCGKPVPMPTDRARAASYRCPHCKQYPYSQAAGPPPERRGMQSPPPPR